MGCGLRKRHESAPKLRNSIAEGGLGKSSAALPASKLRAKESASRERTVVSGLRAPFIERSTAISRARARFASGVTSSTPSASIAFTVLSTSGRNGSIRSSASAKALPRLAWNRPMVGCRPAARRTSAEGAGGAGARLTSTLRPPYHRRMFTTRPLQAFRPAKTLHGAELCGARRADMCCCVCRICMRPHAVRGAQRP